MAIGCDGSHSRVREFLVGHEAAQLEPVDLTMINFPMQGYRAEEARLLQTLHPVFKIAAHPNKPGNGMLAGTYHYKSYTTLLCLFFKKKGSLTTLTFRSPGHR